MDTASSNWHGDSGSPSGVNAQRLLWAGFMAILAAGVGFSIRAGILGQWAEQYGFTQTELGAITGGGLTGFGIIILLSSLIADRIGFGPLMFAAFVMHLISAVLTLATGAAFEAGGKPLAFQCLFWGMFCSRSATASPKRWSIRWWRPCSRRTRRTTSTSSTPGGRVA